MKQDANAGRYAVQERIGNRWCTLTTHTDTHKAFWWMHTIWLPSVERGVWINPVTMRVYPMRVWDRVRQWVIIWPEDEATQRLMRAGKKFSEVLESAQADYRLSTDQILTMRAKA